MGLPDFAALRAASPTRQTTVPKRAKLPRHTHGTRFLKGPIPLDWLSAASRCPGKALHVAVVLWFYAGMTVDARVPLKNIVLEEFGVNRFAKYRALDVLEKAGLVAVDRRRGAGANVTILPLE